jgi:hypothetical protein
MPSVQKDFLIINTIFYPYLQDGVAYDSYINKEIEVLANKFEKVIVIPHINPLDTIRKMPDNVVLHEVRPSFNFKNKLKGLFFIFKKDFYSELFFYMRVNKKVPGWKVVKLLLGSYSLAMLYYRSIKKLIPKSKNTTTFLYSYWLFEFAYAAGRMKKK